MLNWRNLAADGGLQSRSISRNIEPPPGPKNPKALPKDQELAITKKYNEGLGDPVQRTLDQGITQVDPKAPHYGEKINPNSSGWAPVTSPNTGVQDYDSYEGKPLSEQEWEHLTSSQQRAVVANQLLFEASTAAPEDADRIYGYLGLNEDARKNLPKQFATMDDIRDLAGQGRGDVSILNTKSVTGLGDRKAVLDHLREIAARISPNWSNEGTVPSALNLDKDIPTDIGQYLGRGLTKDQMYALDDLASPDPKVGTFGPMIQAYKEGLSTNPDFVSAFNLDFGEKIAGLPLDEVKSRFKAVATEEGAKDSSLDIEAMMKFYGLGG